MESIQSWSRRGKCRSETKLDFVSDDAKERSEAKKICTGQVDGRICPVLDLCKTYAIVHKEMGIWGGTSFTDRQNIHEVFVTSMREYYYRAGLLEYRPGEIQEFLRQKEAQSREHIYPNDTRLADLVANQDRVSAI